MKKILAFLLLISLGGLAAAQWVRVAASDEADYYVDPASIRTEGDLRRFSALDDFKARQKDDELSALIQEEFDCKNRRRRFLAGSDHSGPMGSGSVLATFNKPGDWRVILPDSVGQVKLAFVCSR